MWINFRSFDRFAIKVHVGGVNAVSGEPMIENAATKLRRLNRVAQNKSVQDYIVTPDQVWLDGIASNDGHVRQFVATPLGTGYSVEVQMTGEDVMGGLQFEITPTTEQTKPYSHPLAPSPPSPPSPPSLSLPDTCKFQAVASSRYPITEVHIKTLTGKTIVLNGLSPSVRLWDIKNMIQDKEGIPIDQQRLVSHGWQLENGIGIILILKNAT